MPPLEPVALSLGGNLGDVPARFAWVVGELTDAGLRQAVCSGAYRTAPVGCAPGTPDFWNAAVVGQWHDGPTALLRLCKSLEAKAGRLPAPPRPDRLHASRTLDIDLLLLGDRVASRPGLALPHPEARRRLFVLVPLAEIAPEWHFPQSGGQTVAQALGEASRDAGPGAEDAIRATRRPLHLSAVRLD
jgi:2-amino-4-hydroxy-6-hydroxymethyldihydropteridine diphosphokinase